ncbi:MAG TPA: response regulator, partial [Acidimicrobiales bacterium]|nr:response regulator [Acidimicrobiales bacterium]
MYNEITTECEDDFGDSRDPREYVRDDHPDPASSSSIPLDGSITVLVVDDELSFTEALSLGLEREGFSVVVAHDGVEALSKLEAHDPDIVLLDLMLPGIS